MEDILVVVDVNVFVRACLQLDVSTWPDDWRRPPATLEEAALSLIAAAAGLAPDVATPPSLKVYSSEDLDDLVVRKLIQPDSPDLRPEERGLGFAESHAVALYQEVVDVLDARGGSVGLNPPPAPQPLPGADYEDRCIWGLFREAMSREPTSAAFLVTDDRWLAANAMLAAKVSNPQRPPWAAMSPASFCSALARRLGSD